MGANESKPGSAEVWKSSGPAGISQDLVSSLQSSNETDASRSKLLEIQIQARVADELRKLQQKESETLSQAHDRLANAPAETTKDTDASKEEAQRQQATRQTVKKEIEELRQKLEDKKKLRQLPESVETARSQVIRCLREHDRRPLDCWQEVDHFKAEVKKLEKTWIDKVTS